jgi:hypothetical protein
MNKIMHEVIFYLGIATMAGMAPRRLLRGPKRKPQTKCLLPGCGKWTTHNGGYCCADHCKKHRLIKKGDQSYAA